MKLVSHPFLFVFIFPKVGPAFFVVASEIAYLSNVEKHFRSTFLMDMLGKCLNVVANVLFNIAKWSSIFRD